MFLSFMRSNFYTLQRFCVSYAKSTKKIFFFKWKSIFLSLLLFDINQNLEYLDT